MEGNDYIISTYIGYNANVDVLRLGDPVGGPLIFFKGGLGSIAVPECPGVEAVRGILCGSLPFLAGTGVAIGVGVGVVDAGVLGEGGGGERVLVGMMKRGGG